MSEDSLDVRAFRVVRALQKALVDLQPLVVDLMRPPQKDERTDPWAAASDASVPAMDGTIQCAGPECMVRREPRFMLALTIPGALTPKYFHSPVCMQRAMI
jgi:hypothetical protein